MEWLYAMVDTPDIKEDAKSELSKALVHLSSCLIMTIYGEMVLTKYIFILTLIYF